MIALTACGKPEPAADPESEAPPSTPDPPQQKAPPTQAPAAEIPSAPPGAPRLELEAEFHRSRVISGGGFWALGTVTNHHASAILDPRAELRLLDAEGEVVAEAQAPLGRAVLAPGQTVAAAVAVEPREHEELAFTATGVASDTPAPPALPLELQHDAPQRAELGGYFVLGQVKNQGDAAYSGVRLEVRGFDSEDRLLGIDWLELDPIEAGETVQFDLGGLRYEEPPRRFELELLGPA